MATLVDSYSESNQNNTDPLDSSAGDFQGAGQSFTATGGNLYSAKFYIAKSGSPTGFAVAKLYAHGGTFGLSSVPTGTALATSDNFDVSTLTTSLALNELLFTGANQYAMSASKYVITLEYGAGSGTNFVSIGSDSTSPTHGGNYTLLQSAAWAAFSGVDLCFYVYKVDPSGFRKNALKPYPFKPSFVGRR